MAKSIYSLYIPHLCHYLSKIQNRSLSSLLKSLQWLLSTIRQCPSALGDNAYLSSLISGCFHLGHCQLSVLRWYGSCTLSSITFMPLHSSTLKTWISLSASTLRHHSPVPASLSQQRTLSSAAPYAHPDYTAISVSKLAIAAPTLVSIAGVPRVFVPWNWMHPASTLLPTSAGDQLHAEADGGKDLVSSVTPFPGMLQRSANRAHLPNAAHGSLW